jgi:hypothetical protein
LQLCTITPNAQWSLRCAGRVVQNRSRQQHKNGPVGRLYLWKEWSTRTVVDASSTQALTLPFSSSHNVRSQNPTGGFPETHLAISHDERKKRNRKPKFQCGLLLRVKTRVCSYNLYATPFLNFPSHLTLVKFIKLKRTQSVCTREKEREKERENREEIKFFVFVF